MSTAAWWALVLARDPDTWAELLAGDPVEPSRLDPTWLEHAKALRLVQLDVCAIDLLSRSTRRETQRAA